MLCDICHKNIASVHVTEIVEDKVVELHICQSCANLKSEDLKYQLNLSDFLAGLVERPIAKRSSGEHCPLCGLTFKEFKRQGKLGCNQCYQVFKEDLLPLFRKIHGSVQHIGKCPKKAEEDLAIEQRIKELRERLARAVKLEEYEEAASIRDALKNWEKRKRKEHNV